MPEPIRALRENRLNGEADIATLAALIGDEARAAMLLALFRKGEALSASSLASHARVGLPAASKHLAKLVGGGLLACEPHGRERRYSLRDDQVAQLLELMSALAPLRGTRTLNETSKLAALRVARTCYDHLAGRLGVGVFDALVQRGALLSVERTTDPHARRARSGLGAVALGPGAASVFEQLGVAFDHEPPAATACLDWTEQRPHLSGALGADVCTAFLERGWVIPRPNSRALRVTDIGSHALARLLQMEVSNT
jgi:DNA-binding transcriptional ArsR family regulator